MGKKPQNFFFSYPFWIGVSIVLGVSNATISDIINNGNSITKDIALASTVAAGIASAAKKLEDEEHLYTNNWCPVGRNKEEVDTTQPVTSQAVAAPSLPISAPLTDTATTTTTTQAIDTVIKDVETVTSIVQNPLNLLKVL